MTELNEKVNGDENLEEVQNSNAANSENAELQTVNIVPESKEEPLLTSTSNMMEVVEIVEPNTQNAETVSNETPEIHDDEEHEELEAEEELPDFSKLSKKEILEFAKKFVAEKSVNEAIKLIKLVQPIVDELEKDEENAALQKFIDEGGTEEDFEYKHDGTKEWFLNTYKELKDKRNAQLKAAEEERLQNLKRKREILDEIKKLNESEETENSFKILKELQAEWRKIKNVPKEFADELWETYRVYNEIFFDKLSINKELIELDRSKNLDQKIELIAQVSKLTEEQSIKKALIGVKKFQEEWRNIGPVSKEASEDIWNRFKTEVDKVYAYIKEQTAKMEEQRQQNLEAKKAIIEKAKELASFTTNKTKEWYDKTAVANELMDEWKKIGYVPLSVRDSIWNEFKNLRNMFFQNKNTFFKSLQEERNANLKAKELLCERAEKIAENPIEWLKLTNEIKELQAQWKTIGAAPEKVNDAVWKRFRSACDLFFEKKNEYYRKLEEEQLFNLNEKKKLIEQLEELNKAENPENVFATLKNIQTTWNTLGYVPAKEKDAINKKYNDLLDALYGKYKTLNKEMREEREKQHFELLATSPNGHQKLQREEKILLERIRSLKKDIDTWDNNLGFFKSGNAKNPMAQQIESKIELANKQIANLEEKLKALREIKASTAQNKQ
ncbi:MAG: DUF349 domain-containing protein [Bacteroidia bacterium]